MDFRHNLQKYHEYIESLEHERQKILVFRRELPLCLELVTQALEACKRQLGTAECLTAGGQSDQSSEQTATTSSNRRPVLAEFIPVKRACSSSSSSSHNNDNDDDDDDVAGEEDLPSHPLQHRRPKISSLHDSDESCIMKSDWLRSVQLWNQTSPSPPTTTREQENRPTRKVSVVEVKSNGGAFKPFQKAKTCPNNAVTKPAPEATSASSAAKKGEKEGLSSQRKTRRCWSPELHKRFLNALQELGGSHVATPKQIREMMKVDGLTNDEVKSHLQVRISFVSHPTDLLEGKNEKHTRTHTYMLTKTNPSMIRWQNALICYFKPLHFLSEVSASHQKTGSEQFQCASSSDCGCGWHLGASPARVHRSKYGRRICCHRPSQDLCTSCCKRKQSRCARARQVGAATNGEAAMYTTLNSSSPHGQYGSSS